MGKNYHPDTLPYNSEIGKRIRDLSAGGIKVREIFSDIQRFASAPGSMSTFYKLYSDDLHAPKIEISRQIGNKVANQALDGDDDAPNTWKAREFWLRTQANWTPKEGLETREVGTDEEENESAVDALMKALGKETDEDDSST